MPPNHQKYISWNGERFRSWAAKIGENSAVLVELFLSRNKVEQQGYKACMALLKLADKYSVQRLEDACAKALSYTPRPSLKSVQAILKSGQDKLQDNDVNPKPPSDTSEFSFTRGAEYYKGRAN